MNEYFYAYKEERPDENCDFRDFCQEDQKIEEKNTKPNSRKDIPNKDNLDGRLDHITRICKSRNSFLYKIFAKKNLSKFNFKKPNHKKIFERIFLNETDKNDKKKLDKWYKEFIQHNNKSEVFKKLEKEKITGYLYLVFSLIKKYYSDDNDVKEFIEEYFKNEKINQETFMIPEFNKTFNIEMSIDDIAETYYFKIIVYLDESNFKVKFPEIKYDTKQDKNGGNLNDKFYRILEFKSDQTDNYEDNKLNEKTISGLTSNESTSPSDFRQNDEFTDENKYSSQCNTDFHINLNENKEKNEKSKKSIVYKHVTTKSKSKDVEMCYSYENEISVSKNFSVGEFLINSPFNEHNFYKLKNSLENTSDSTNLDSLSNYKKFLDHDHDNHYLGLNEGSLEEQTIIDENFEEKDVNSLAELDKFNFFGCEFDSDLFLQN